MINSIKYFEEECISRFEKLENDFLMIQDSPVRLKKWVVETHSTKQLTTSLGT